jgi:UDP-N-acetylmuramoylalanine-D-glutamate ligase
MGKFKPSDELNCGSCGYNTCRDKAVAIYQGKADISMCLPFLKEKAESFSDAIVKNSPNALVVVNDTLEVQQLNDAALKLLNIRFASDVLGDQVVRILDPKAFLDVKRSRRGVYNKRTYLAEYDRYVDQTIVPAEDGRMIICIMHDVTAEEEARQRKEEISHQTVEVADKVVERQMLIVQEIASLLGETTAETKIPLSKLKAQVRKLEGVPHRLQLIRRGGGITVIDDAYNSNPTGSKAAIDALSLFDGYKILVTPGMVELGDRQAELNQAFGAHAASVCDYVVLVGKANSQSIREGLLSQGYPAEKIFMAERLQDGLNQAYALDPHGKEKIILLENDLPDNF